MADTGIEASCFFLENRSSCAAATISPSRTRHAALSWYSAEIPRMCMRRSAGRGNFVLNGNKAFRARTVGLHARPEEVLAASDRDRAARRRHAVFGHPGVVGGPGHLQHSLSARGRTTDPAKSEVGLTPARRRLFLAITLLSPLIALAAIEGILRLAWPGGAIPLFGRAPMGAGQYLIANPRVATRWFITEASPPNPLPEPFAATKPPNGFRVFALGESTTAGFPYPRNVSFPRLLHDALRDVLPDDSVEVVNLGIPATNSYALRDIAGDVIAQKPDAIVLYAGHNEYYGALGVGSTERLGGGGFANALLALQRLRVVMALRNGVVALRR